MRVNENVPRSGFRPEPTHLCGARPHPIQPDCATSIPRSHFSSHSWGVRRKSFPFFPRAWEAVTRTGVIGGFAFSGGVSAPFEPLYSSRLWGHNSKEDSLC